MCNQSQGYYGSNNTLSPAAQAVLDAWESKLDPMVTCLTHDPEREALAAALRVTADQFKYKLLGVEVVDCSQLRLLADELEA